MKTFSIRDVQVFPLKERNSLSSIDEVMQVPETTPNIEARQAGVVSMAAEKIREARESNASRIFIYGAHLIKNGGNPMLIKLMEQGWITHLATNGAGIIHDWEYAFLGQSTECVKSNVKKGQFGTWDETGRSINLSALMAGYHGLGLGGAVGKFVDDDGLHIPSPEELIAQIQQNPRGKKTPAISDLLRGLEENDISPGKWVCQHKWKHYCVSGNAYKMNIPLTVHPGIGYDIFTNHPMFQPSAIGRAAGKDFEILSESVSNLEKGVTFSIGSAIMGPQVFEKSMSCVNNIRLQNSKHPIDDHTIYVVDLQDGGNWNWSKGEPPIDNPAYYLRFCKSYSRMGGQMDYLNMDNIAFIYHLSRELGVME